MGGVFPIYYNITIGGEGSTGTPNLYYVINGQPLICMNYRAKKNNSPKCIAKGTAGLSVECFGIITSLIENLNAIK